MAKPTKRIVSPGPQEGPRALTPKNIAIRLVLLSILVGLSLYFLLADGRQQGILESPSQQAAVTELRGNTMGTTWLVKVVAPSQQALAPITQSAVQDILSGVDDAMSTWKPQSEISRFNRHASEELFPLSAPTLEVLTIAQEVARQSQGAFDITVDPLVELWGFNTAAKDDGSWRAPTPEAIEQTRGKVGYQHLHIEAAGARKTVPQLEVDLSAIAKGYAVDLVARWLEQQGIQRYMVEVGGEVRVLGQNANQMPWRIGIEQPQSNGDGLYAVVELTRGALATSGTYRNFVESEGRHLSHMIDPRTGQPVEHPGVSVSVQHDSCALADAWATALLVLGPQEGYAAALHNEVGALFIARGDDGTLTQRATPNFPPTLSPKESSP